jgi:hypothetical protein
MIAGKRKEHTISKASFEAYVAGGTSGEGYSETDMMTAQQARYAWIVTILFSCILSSSLQQSRSATRIKHTFPYHMRYLNCVIRIAKRVLGKEREGVAAGGEAALWQDGGRGTRKRRGTRFEEVDDLPRGGPRLRVRLEAARDHDREGLQRLVEVLRQLRHHSGRDLPLAAPRK